MNGCFHFIVFFILFNLHLLTIRAALFMIHIIYHLRYSSIVHHSFIILNHLNSDLTFRPFIYFALNSFMINSLYVIVILLCYLLKGEPSFRMANCLVVMVAATPFV